jgi:hypothetical protein
LLVGIARRHANLKRGARELQVPVHPGRGRFERFGAAAYKKPATTAPRNRNTNPTVRMCNSRTMEPSMPETSKPPVPPRGGQPSEYCAVLIQLDESGRKYF